MAQFQQHNKYTTRTGVCVTVYNRDICQLAVIRLMNVMNAKVTEQKKFRLSYIVRIAMRQGEIQVKQNKIPGWEILMNC